MIAHKIWIFCQVDGLQGQPPQTFSAVDALQHSCETRHALSVIQQQKQACLVITIISAPASDMCIRFLMSV
jgi:hypothetical protein